MLSHYHTSIDPDEENDAHSCLLRMVGFNKRVLEAGCASGHVSEALKAQGCSVVGVEIDAQVVKAAEQWVERVIIGNFDDGQLWDELEGEFFDAVLFGDVLEHLKDPLSTLQESMKHLNETGAVVISVPNIAHADVKIALLKGTFPYSQSGLLDVTHIHFFTKESLLELVREAGLVPIEFQRVSVPVFGTEIPVDKNDVDDQALEAILADRESLTYQFVLKAVRADGSGPLGIASQGLIALSDRLVDEQRRYDALATMYQTNLNDLAYLRHQMDVAKKLIPTPLRRLARKVLARRQSQ
jgi:2-polyprenyl-3-methyl-5-hydroxy-6-metoxy-1,4-benzoquinol methylase